NMEGSVRNRVRKYNGETLDPAYVYKNSTLNQNILKHSYRKQALLLSKSRVAVTQNMIVGGRSYKAIPPSYNEIKLITHKMNGKGYLLETAVFKENTKDSSLHSTGKRACSVAVFEKV
ncbi:MAG: hypothetical protein MUO60_16965, partial [Clostridiaceae bacterium]|nr:hypothetical protein [Clostridiaceae bacterium]